MNQYSLIVGVNDLVTTHPILAKEWDYEKNVGFKPEDFSKGSTKKVWWKCSNNHSWSAVIYSRVNGTGCPFCSNNKVLPGYNDLESTCPELIKEWDYNKNGKLLPQNVAPLSGRKVWWICEKKHSWQAAIGSRSSGRGCPYCTNRQILVGYNDLETVREDIAREWHPKKNGEIKPNEVLAGSHKSFWWMCEKGHEWKTQISNRINGTGCPFCINKAILTGFNDLGTKYPTLIKEWDYEKNYDLNPEELASSSKRSVWWKCSQGHSWKALIVNRALRGNGCPYCSGRKSVEGVNDFATEHPDLLSEWDWENNRRVKPHKLTHQSRKVIWWKCNKGHSYQAEVYRRVNGAGCPYCNKKKDKHRVVPGINDLYTCFPELANEWDELRNGELKPTSILPNSNRSVWWKCSNGHHWRTTPNARIIRTTGCPYCVGKVPKKMKLI